VSVPTIGIGAGIGCDGQVLVCYDLLGMDDTFKPKFVRRYEQLSVRIRTAVQSFVSDVRSGAFPAAAESFALEVEKKPTETQTPMYSSVANK
jgi:3-methyl-2-oxobutanoate hydroxymethyltransferase